MRKNLGAFTLIEMLLVCVLVSVIGLAVFRCFANGLRLWEKAQHLNNEAQAAIFLEKLADDLRSTVVLSGFNFKGTTSQLSFPAVVLTKADPKSSRVHEELINQIGAVSYRFDYEQHAIFRKQANYAQALKDKWQDAEVPVVTGIEQLEFHYDVSSDKGFLLKSQISEGIPSGVIVEVKFMDAGGQHQLRKYLAIPVGA